jgi:transposase
VNGKPRIVYQKYLGRAEDIARAMEGKELDNPKYSLVFEFGASCALYELAKQLGVVELIDRYAPKRNQGLTLGEYMLVAAINRAVQPKSKVQIADWYAKTMLDRIWPIPKRLLSSQRFWDNMGLLTEEAIEKFEDEFTALLVKKYGLATECLIYDTTNFFTYIDTLAPAKLPRRGHSKEKRVDLKIVGLAMLVSPDFHVPLFHAVYPGNVPDPVEFRTVLEKLKARFRKICGEPEKVTLVFDKGNNSLGNINLLDFKVVGSLKLSQGKPLLEIPKKEFAPVPGERYQGVTAYRCKYPVYGREMTVLVVHNPELLAGQLQGITNNIEKCTFKLRELQRSLAAGKKVKSLPKKVKDILHDEFMEEIFDLEFTDGQFNFSLNTGRLEYIQERYLGKTILFTDNHDWPNEKIISAYRSQYHIEDAFRQMKNTHFLGFRPIYHWTDQKIKVHAFYCVLGLRLCCLLNRTLAEHGIHLSINKMLALLAEIKQVITVYPKKGASKKDRESFSLSKMGPQEKKILEILDIKKYALGG